MGLYSGKVATASGDVATRASEKALRCNFQVTQCVEFDGAFGSLDVHNAYDLTAFDRSPDGSGLRIAFVGNEYLLKGRPKQFEVLFQGVTLLEVTGLPMNLPDLCIDEIGFKSPDDREYEWALDDGVPGDQKHLVFKGDVVGEGALIRVSAETGTVVCRPYLADD